MSLEWSASYKQRRSETHVKVNINVLMSSGGARASHEPLVVQSPLPPQLSNSVRRWTEFKDAVGHGKEVITWSYRCGAQKPACFLCRIVVLQKKGTHGLQRTWIIPVQNASTKLQETAGIFDAGNADFQCHLFELWGYLTAVNKLQRLRNVQWPYNFSRSYFFVEDDGLLKFRAI